MKAPFESDGSSLTLGLGLIGLALTDVFYAIVIPGVGLGPGPGELLAYSLSFIVWMSFGVSLGLIQSSRRAGLVFILGLLLLSITYAFSSQSPSFKSFAYAYPGFFNGGGLAGLFILIKRHVLKTTKRRYKPSKFEWEDLIFRYGFLTLVLLYSALVVAIVYLLTSPNTLLVDMAMLLILMSCATAILSRRETLRRQKHGRAVARSRPPIN
ncbi:MAG: hypothetical protein ABSB29_08180 [Nitrososphaerales archaeon]